MIEQVVLLVVTSSRFLDIFVFFCKCVFWCFVFVIGSIFDPMKGPFWDHFVLYMYIGSFDRFYV